MKITYYGTAAAEGWPALFCRCESCEKARKLGGRNIRTRSQALIDDGLLIDFPPDTYMHVLHGGLDLTKVHSLLITHNHFDHFAPSDFWCRIPGIAYEIREEAKVMTVYGSEFIGKRLENYSMSVDAEKRIAFSAIHAEETFEVRGYSVTPLAACHGTPGDAHIYVIEKDGKCLLYGHDTGYFLDEVWAWFEKCGKHLDFVSLDCTNIVGDGRIGHMGVAACRDVKARLLEIGVADSSTTFVVNHFSHNGKTVYDDLAAELEGEFIVTYDGLSLEF